MEMKFVTTDEMGVEVAVTIEYEITPGCIGARENGIPIEPDLPAEVEILSVVDGNGEPYELLESDVESVVDIAFEEAKSAKEDYEAERAISRYGMRGY